MSEVEQLKRRLKRERKGRKQAEQVAEQKTFELYQANQELQQLAENLTEADKELRDTLSYLSTIMANLVDGLLVVNAAGKITHFNPALLKMFRLEDTDLADKDLASFNSKVIELVETTKKQPAGVFTAEVELAEARIGKAVATAILKSTPSAETTTPSTNNNDGPLGSIVLIRDITEETEVDRMKTDFISTVSHEMRTPLTSILGFAKIIKKKLDEVIFPIITVEDKKTKRAIKQVAGNINIIVAEGERLTALINDVLDIAKMEAGKIEWNMQPLSLSGVLERAVMATSALFEQKDVKLIRDVEVDLPEIVGDHDRLIQVIINLISNAVKFTDEGSVICRAGRVNGEIKVSVIDTGMGIAEGDQPKVFERFKQVGDTLIDKPQGTGLGLSICKQIVEHHGGRIWVESKLGQGSTFSFTLPTITSVGPTPEAWAKTMNINTLIRQLQAHGVTPLPSPVEAGQKTILVVDDEPHIRELLRLELEAKGYLVREAKDGMDAIAQVKKEMPDLITLDVMMPDIDGFDVAAVLRNDPQTAGVPIIILSIVEDKARGYSLGVDRYLKKPIDTETLLEEVEFLLSQGASKKKVLVVDEDVSAVKTLSEVLKTQGYSVSEASIGNELIEKAKSMQPDMIIINSILSEQHHEIVKTLRFEKGLENVLLFLFQEASPT